MEYIEKIKNEIGTIIEIQDTEIKIEVCKIYLLTNTINNKIYIGQTWLELKARMGKNGVNYSNSPYLYAALQKYGSSNFKYEILVKCEDQETADFIEDYYIEQYKSRDSDIGYNLKQGGRGGKHSEESKAKISRVQKEKAEQWSPEERSRRVAPIAGWWAGKERGPLSDQQKKFISEVNIERHKNTPHPMLGEHHTDEAKAKMSKALKGVPISEERREVLKISGLARRNPERDQEIIKLYQDGKTIANIKEKLNTSAGQIYRVLNRNNIAKKKDKE